MADIVEISKGVVNYSKPGIVVVDYDNMIESEHETRATLFLLVDLFEHSELIEVIEFMVGRLKELRDDATDQGDP